MTVCDFVIAFLTLILICMNLFQGQLAERYFEEYIVSCESNI